MFCRQCGKVIAETSSFCGECGAAAHPSGAVVTVQPGNPQVQQVYIQNPSAGKDQMVWGALILVLGIFGSMFSCGVSVYSTGWPGGIGLIFSLILIIVGAAVYFSGKFDHWYKSE